MNEQLQVRNNSANKIHTTKSSNQIFDKKKEDVFREIYSILDKNNRNLISTHNLNTKSLPDSINKTLNPIYKEIREDNETLTKDEFVRAMNHLFNVLKYFYLVFKI